MTELPTLALPTLPTKSLSGDAPDIGVVVERPADGVALVSPTIAIRG